MSQGSGVVGQSGPRVGDRIARAVRVRTRRCSALGNGGHTGSPNRHRTVGGLQNLQLPHTGSDRQDGHPIDGHSVAHWLTAGVTAQEGTDDNGASQEYDEGVVRQWSVAEVAHEQHHYGASPVVQRRGGPMLIVSPATAWATSARVARWRTNVNEDIQSLFADESLTDPGAQQLFSLLHEPSVMQIVVNRHDRVFYTDDKGTQLIDRVFPSAAQYVNFLNQVLTLTDVGYRDVTTARTSVIEGSFNPQVTDIHGSVHIATHEITRGEPIFTVRKQPREIIMLDDMQRQHMMDGAMNQFLQKAIRGRANILISGGSGAGKTTLARALSWYIDPNQRVLTVEEIDELHLYDRLPNVASLTSYKDQDEFGRIVRRTELEDLVREALRMRADRIWVGETRGREAYALVKACNSGHDGSITTVHADDGQGAVKQLISYVMEANVPEEVARDQVANAFHLVVQIQKVRMGRRVITEITELERVREGTEQRRTQLFTYNIDTDSFQKTGNPTKRLANTCAKYGVSLSDTTPTGF